MPPTVTRLLSGALLLALGLAIGAAPVLAQAPAAGDTLPTLEDRTGDFLTDPARNPIDLRDPSAVEREVTYDPATGRYLVTERIGGEYFRAPTYLTFEEYQAYRERQRRQDYFDRLQGRRTDREVGVGQTSLEDPIAAVDVSNSLMNRLFGGDDVNIDPRGNIDLTLGADVRRVLNPSFTRRQQINGGFDFQMGIQMNVTGTIGEKLQLSANYNNNANFSFDRQLIKVTYNAADFGEDEILQNIEAGNVSLPLRSSLIQGSQGLMGIRADFKFGDLKLTALASQQKTERNEIEIKGGAQFQEFAVRADEYDENRHFLLSHFNREAFEGAFANLPQINSLFKINRVEVWITNDRNQTEGVRQLVALADLGESLRLTDDVNNALTPGNTGRSVGGQPLPDNAANDLYARMLEDPALRQQDNAVDRLERAFDLDQAIDFERVTARLLSPSEFSFHPELGFVSVNVNVRPDQVLAVAYEYTYNGRVYRVGEFSNDVSTGDSLAQDVLFTRLLKTTTPRVDVPAWDLMMKNFYNIGAYQVNREDFRLDITYEDPGGGQKRFLPASNLANVPLIRVFGVDQLNVQLDPQPDGIFDFVPGLTIYPRNGRIMFPVLEPFGDALEDQIAEEDFRQQYVYDILYDSTVVRAREYPEFNRFIIRGSYKSSVSSEISLGAFNIPRGSVRVTAGGQILREGQDYEIDYNIGRIKILNDAYLNSGVPVRVSFEDSAVFGLQNRSMVGLRADYEVNRKLSVGATYLHLFERPYTQKVNVGEDPINNRIFGADVVYGDEAPWLTRLVDKIPGISTIAPSSINFSAEAALLKPGHSRAIDFQEGEGGTVYVDDFEGSASGFDLKTPLAAWTLASVPQNNPLFPEAPFTDSSIINANRALLNWYRVDLQGRSAEAREGREAYGRAVNPQEIFPGRQLNQFQNNALFTFDLSYYPDERGPYNFDLPDGYPGISAGLTSAGRLDQPRTRWGGVMRDLTTNDFQAANIEYLEFWVLSPFLDREFGERSTEGDLYIEFGNISEDIMRDSRLFFEQGLPGDGNDNRPVDFNNLGRIPRSQPITPGFDTDPESRELQDVGFDGLNDDDERAKFSWWLDQLPAAGISQERVSAIRDDPANDNFVSFTDVPDSEFTPTRYRGFNGFEGNSPISTGNDFAVGFSTLPDTEDVNGDNTLSENEAYFQYRIPLVPDDTETDGGIDLAEARYVTQVREIPAEGDEARMVWYRFKVPLDQFDARVGSIQDFRSIRFMRMYMTGFETPVTLRFARLDLVRNQWRRYLRLSALRPPGPQVAPPDVDVFFDVDAINIEENAGREPFGYVLPVGIQRERQLNTLSDVRQNEQSQVITVCGLPDGDARAIYKIVNLDMRVFERLRMFVHAEEFDPAGTATVPRNLEDDDLEMFVRLGSDFQDNYYEYTLPLSFTRVGEVDPNGSPDDVSAAIWKPANEVDIDLEALVDLKKRRNADPNLDVTDLFTEALPGDDSRAISITGNPTLGLVKGVMIGLRNRRGGAAETCAQVWVNELRLNGLDEQGGGAGLARLDLQLADFGQISASTSFSTIGWGALDQKLAERQRESSLVYDVTGSFELGKFLPESSGVRIPATAVYSNNVRRPEYDPYDLDVLLAEKLDEADPNDVDSLREQAVDRVVQREINFTNVRKERTSNGVPLPWDVSNFSVSYVYNETDRTNPLIELDETVNHYAALDYAYAAPPVTVEPFKNLIDNDQYFNLLRDFNVNPLPNRFAFSTTMDRELQSTRYRFAGDDPRFTTFFNRNWTWDRDYVLNWDVSRGLRFQFNATNRAVIDELPTFGGPNNDQPFDDDFRREQVWEAVRNFGRTKAYQHRFDANYTLPTKQIPYLDFANVTAQYSGSYNWNAAALNLQEDGLGNVISNANQRQARGDLNFEQLYRKIPYLQRVENGNGPGNTRQPRRPSRNNADRLREREERVGEGDDDDEEDEPRALSELERALVRPLLSLRRANVTYSEDYGTTLPGFLPEPEYLGLSRGFEAPGWAFIGGYQPEIRDAEGLNYLYQQTELWSQNISLNQQVYQTYSQNLAVQVSAEPFKDFRVDLDLSRQFTENHSEFYKDTLDNGIRELRRLVPTDIGSYSISYGALTTLFGDTPEDLFEQFEAARLVVSERLGGDTPHDDPELAERGFKQGYGPQQQDVQLAAFLAAYTGQDPGSVGLDVFKIRPKVNWRVTYNGLGRLEAFKDLFASFSLTHSYKSTLTVNSFNTNLFYDGPETVNPVSQSYYTQLVIPDLVISEQFAPLLGIDARLKNDMSLRVSVSKSRSLGMSFVDNRLAERNAEEYSLGWGYTVRNVDLLQYFGGNRKRGGRRGRRGRARDEEEPDDDDADNPRQRQQGGRGGGVGNDLDLQLDVRYADDETINRILDQGVDQATRGAQTFTLSPSAEYEVNRQLSLRLFVDYRTQRPANSISFPTRSTQAGLTVRFKLN